MKPKIELQKTRDFGEVISDTFGFIAQNFKPLLICFITFNGLLLVAGGVVQALQQMDMMDTMKSITDPLSPAERSDLGPFSFINWGYLAATLVLMMVTYNMISTSVLSFIALYRDKGNVAPTTEEVWGYIKYYFFRVMGSSLLLGVLLVIGFVLCMLPGIWLFPIFSITISVIVMENAGFGYAFNHSFTLVKDNWWISFGTLFVIYMITSMFSAIVTLPAAAFNVFSLLTTHHRNGIMLSNTAIITSSILKQISLVFLIIPYVAQTLIYFNLNEIKEGTGIMSRINMLGQKDDPADNLPAEEY